MQRTIQHLNDQARSASAYAVEVVRFQGGAYEAFEARTVVGPTSTSSSTTTREKIDQDEFLSKVTDPDYRDAIEQLLAFAAGQGIVVVWGDAGVSLRARVPGASHPLTLAWLNPPGRTGWMGQSDLTLGYDPGQAEDRLGSPSPPALTTYMQAVESLPDVEEVATTQLQAFWIPPDTVVAEAGKINELLASVSERVAES